MATNYTVRFCYCCTGSELHVDCFKGFNKAISAFVEVALLFPDNLPCQFTGTLFGLFLIVVDHQKNYLPWEHKD
jgi:hypothetical protein